MSSERIVKDIQGATRKQDSAEVTIGNVLDGLRGEHGQRRAAPQLPALPLHPMEADADVCCGSNRDEWPNVRGSRNFLLRETQMQNKFQLATLSAKI
jgi:hypothetical protein